jgi:SAM-dependent methyltransferase
MVGRVRARGPEIQYFRRFVEEGQPALDAGCGTGRLLAPCLRAGLDVDGCDASADMVALCRERARREGLEPTLFVQPLHEFDPPRRYRTIVACGVFGLGSTRAPNGRSVAVEEHTLSMRMYFPTELVLLLERAGFADIEVRGDHNDPRPTPTTTSSYTSPAPRRVVPT